MYNSFPRYAEREGWMIKIRVDNPGELSRLLAAADYKQHIGE